MTIYDMDLTLRHGEKSLPPNFRTSRLVCRNNQWFCLLRGGGVSGPFNDQPTAMEEVEKIVRVWHRRAMFRLVKGGR